MDNDFGLLVHSNDIYNFYMNSTLNIDTYYLAIPKKELQEYSLYVDIPDKDLRYLDRNTSISELINTIKNNNQSEKIYLFPILPKELILSRENVNDDIINRELERQLISLISEIFDKFIKKNKLLEQCAYLIITNDLEKNLVDWINLNSMYANFIKGYNLPYQKELSEYSGNDHIYDDTDDNSGNSLAGNSESISNSITKPKVKVKKLPNKHGFSNITFIITTIILSLIIGIYLAYLIYDI